VRASHPPSQPRVLRISSTVATGLARTRVSALASTPADGINQQFRRPALTGRFAGRVFCALRNKYCVLRREAPIAPSRPLHDSTADDDASKPACTADAPQLEESCAAWASVGECALSREYMRQHCQAACARAGFASWCRLDEAVSSSAARPDAELGLQVDELAVVGASSGRADRPMLDELSGESPGLL
jgi:hypothetical protein